MGWPLPLSAGAPLPEQSRRRARHVAASCLQPPRPSKLVVASRPRSESKECRFAASPFWFTRAGEVGQLNQADSRSLRSLRNLHRIKSKQSQFWLRAANKRHVLLCSEAASKPMPARSQRSRTNPQVWCLKSSKIDETKSEKAWREQSRARRRLQAFSRKIFHTQSIKGQKWPVKCRNAVEPEQVLQFENLMPEEKRHHGESSKTALLSQNSAAKTARVDYQVVPLPQCHTRCATRALTLAIF